MPPTDEQSPKIKTLDEAESVGGIIANLDIAIKAKEVRKNKLQMAVNRRGKQVLELQASREREALRLRDWCNENPSVMTGGNSLELRHVALRFEWGKDAVRLLEGWTDTLSVQAMRMKSRAKKFTAFIRVKHEIDRQQILRDFKAEKPLLSKTALGGVGLEIGRERFFYCQSKLS